MTIERFEPREISEQAASKPDIVRPFSPLFFGASPRDWSFIGDKG
jgi:hypothetical protein